MGARWYDPVLARFNQPDTVIPNQYDPNSWDRYLYVSANPLRYRDPSGHRACEKYFDDCESDPPRGYSPLSHYYPPRLSLGEISDNVIENIPPEAITGPVLGITYGVAQNQGWFVNGVLFIPVGDNTYIVIMPPGSNPKIERTPNQLGINVIASEISASLDIGEGALILEPTPIIPETLVAFINFLVTAVASYTSGQTYANQSPHQGLPPIIGVGQDILVTGGDLIIGASSPIADAVTTAANGYYDLYMIGGGNTYITIAFPMKDISQTWIILWPYPQN
jgi:hypothetical protein